MHRFVACIRDTLINMYGTFKPKYLALIWPSISVVHFVILLSRLYMNNLHTNQTTRLNKTNHTYLVNWGNGSKLGSSSLMTVDNATQCHVDRANLCLLGRCSHRCRSRCQNSPVSHQVPSHVATRTTAQTLSTHIGKQQRMHYQQDQWRQWC